MRIESLQDHTINSPLQKAEQVHSQESAPDISKMMEKRVEEAKMRDAYTPSMPEDRQPTGLYKVVPDEEGKPTIEFDDPRKQQEPDKLLDSLKANRLQPSDEPPAKENGPARSSAPEKEPEICTTNTDKVDREIRMLKDKAEQVEQQLRAASGTEREEALEKQLRQLENELRQKDNDGYRRQNALVTHS